MFQAEVESLMESLESHEHADIIKGSIRHCVTYGDVNGIAYNLCILKGVPAHNTVVPGPLITEFVDEFQRLYPITVH